MSEYWPFLLTALVVGSWVVWDIAITSYISEQLPPKESAVDAKSRARHSLEDAAAEDFDALPAIHIIEREAESGEPIRLNWADDDTDPHGYAFHRDRGDWPTAVIPVIREGWF